LGPGALYLKTGMAILGTLLFIVLLIKWQIKR
jgi:hypothetical protein